MLEIRHAAREWRLNHLFIIDHSISRYVSPRRAAERSCSRGARLDGPIVNFPKSGAIRTIFSCFTAIPSVSKFPSPIFPAGELGALMQVLTEGGHGQFPVQAA